MSDDDGANAHRFFRRSDLIIEGTVRGYGALRVAGTVKGTVAIAGAIILERGAVIEGEVEAASLTVAPGARMRGTATFGWSASDPTSARSEPGQAHDRGREAEMSFTPRRG